MGVSRSESIRLNEHTVLSRLSIPLRVLQRDFIIWTVGQKAPDFNAPAYYRGSFTNVQLSDYLGTWILLCFYPGDFTFV